MLLTRNSKNILVLGRGQHRPSTGENDPAQFSFLAIGYLGGPLQKQNVPWPRFLSSGIVKGQHCPLGGGERGAEQCTGGANPMVVNIPKVHIQTKVDSLHDRLS